MLDCATSAHRSRVSRRFEHPIPRCQSAAQPSSATGNASSKVIASADHAGQLRCTQMTAARSPSWDWQASTSTSISNPSRQQTHHAQHQRSGRKVPSRRAPSRQIPNPAVEGRKHSHCRHQSLKTRRTHAQLTQRLPSLPGLTPTSQSAQSPGWSTRPEIVVEPAHEGRIERTRPRSAGKPRYPPRDPPFPCGLTLGQYSTLSCTMPSYGHFNKAMQSRRTPA